MGNKFGNISDLQADEMVEKEGIELAFGKGRVLIVTRSGLANRRYRTVLARAMKPYTSATGVITGSDEEVTDKLYEVYAEAVVLGWRGFKDSEGKDIPFNKSNCVELFTDAPEIFEVVRNESAKFSNFARRDTEEAGKE